MRNRLVWILFVIGCGWIFSNCSNPTQIWKEKLNSIKTTSDSIQNAFKQMDEQAMMQTISDAISLQKQVEEKVKETDTLTVEFAQPMDEFLTAVHNSDALNEDFKMCKSANTAANRRLIVLLKDIEEGNYEYAEVPKLIQLEEEEIKKISAHSKQIFMNYTALNEALAQFKPIFIRSFN